jgi:hypothetical protein
MYNWCLNKVKITGKEENLKKISQIINEILYENDELEMMESLIGKDSINAEDYYNDVRWHDVEIKYWGVKWDVKYGDRTSIDNNEYILLEFQTIWHPTEFSKILSKKYDVNVTVNYLEHEMGLSRLVEIDNNGNILRDKTYQYVWKGLYNYDKSILFKKIYEFVGDFIKIKNDLGKDYHNDINENTDEDKQRGFRDNLLSLLNYKK